MRALRYLYELGQPMLLGSDTPSAPTYGNQPGYDTYKEMQLMAQAGIPLSAIFAAATINNARQFGLDKDYGTIEKGKIANLLLLDANPLASVEAWTRIDKVILRGEPIDRETLAADAKYGEEDDLWLIGHYSFSAGASTSTRRPPARSSLRRRPWSKATTLWGTVCLAGIGLTHGLRWTIKRLGWLALPPAALSWRASSRPRLLIATASYLLDDRAVAGGVRHARRADRRAPSIRS